MWWRRRKHKSSNAPESREGALSPEQRENLARAIVNDAVKRYFRKRRSAVPAFVDANYALKPALALHTLAIGHDLWRAPLNAALTFPQLGVNLAARLIRGLGNPKTADWLNAREFFLKTDVNAEIERRLIVDLLELPYGGQAAERTGAPSFRDALAEEILADVRVANALETISGPWGDDERNRMASRLADTIASYLTNRTLADEIANSVVTAGIGVALVRNAAPRLLSFGGGLPLIALSTVSAAFFGVITDPVSRKLGLHHMRLIRFLDDLEASFLSAPPLRDLSDHYAMRLVALFEAFGSVRAPARSSSTSR